MEIKLKSLEQLLTERQKPKLPKNTALVKIGDKILQLKNKWGMWRV